MSEDQGASRSGRDGFKDGVRSVTGLLGALKDAIEATFEDLRSDAETPADRAAPDAAAAAFRKAQEAVEGVRDRFDFVSRREFEALRQEVAALRASLEGRPVAEDAGHAGSAPEASGQSRAGTPEGTAAGDAHS